jgi:hypothetical protein
MIPTQAPIGMSIDQKLAFEKMTDILYGVAPSLIAQSHKSTHRGRTGEMSFDELIRDHFPEFQIEDTSRSQHACDRKLFGDNFTILIEYKNYQSTVPFAQFEKFERDIKESDATFGIFYSINTSVAKFHRERLSFRKVGNAIVCVVPSGGFGVRILHVLEWAVFFCKHRNRVTKSHDDIARITAAAETALYTVDALGRELHNVSDGLRKQLTCLDKAYLQALGSLRTTLRNII